MGIKTRFSTMGGGGDSEPSPSIPDAWLYTNRTNEAGKNTRTLYFYNNTVGGDEVVVPYGHTELQDYYSSTNNAYASLPFYNHTTLTSVDLKNVPFRNNSMVNAFNNCQSLTSVNGINENITSMAGTFYGCSSLNQNIQIPNSVTNMFRTFRACTALKQNIQIPNSVTDMGGTFMACTALKQNIQIPNSVTNMADTFFSCYNLNQNIQIPNSVTSMAFTFQSCFNLNQNIQIPNSVTNMIYTFEGCWNLNQSIQIPNSVTNMHGAFEGCWNLSQNIQISNSVTDMYRAFMDCRNIGSQNKWLNIKSHVVTNINACFYYTSESNMSNQLRVVIPCRYINNAFTTTYNSLLNYYDLSGTKTAITFSTGTGVTQANTTQYRNLLCFDWIGGDWTYTGNGTYWKLVKWIGNMQTRASLDSGAANYNVKIPTHYNLSGGNYETRINQNCFYANTTVTGIDCSSVPFYTGTTTAVNTFRNCQKATYINNVNITAGITTVSDMFRNCRVATKISSGAGIIGIGDINLPTSCTSAVALYAECKSLNNFYVNSNAVTNISYLMDYCNTQPWNLYLGSAKITGVTNFCRSYTTTYRKNIYIYFNYSNGVRTATFNAFKATVYSGTSGNGTSVTQMYNSTSNFYIIDRGIYPE